MEGSSDLLEGSIDWRALLVVERRSAWAAGRFVGIVASRLLIAGRERTWHQVTTSFPTAQYSTVQYSSQEGLASVLHPRDRGELAHAMGSLDAQ